LRPTDPPFAVCEFTTLRASFEEDLAASRTAGATGIGICEIKLEGGREQEQLTAFRASGLAATSCLPAVPSILPLPRFEGPDEPAERVEAIRAGMRRLLPFEPQAFGRRETRSWCDRVLPGDRVADLPAIFGAPPDAGWRGPYELEVLSNDGTFGSAHPDSLWEEDAGELARRGHDAFRQLWDRAAVQMKT
jgi:hypothetical protein